MVKNSHDVGHMNRRKSKNILAFFISTFFSYISLLSGSPKIYVIIGGPGNGKSKLCKALKKKGFDVLREAATEVIKEEQEKGNKEPWKKLDDFQRKILGRQLEYLELVKNKNEKEIVFSDRGIFDAFAYYEYDKLNPIEELYLCVKNIKYAGIFCLAPLPEEIYKKNKIRKETRPEALKMHSLLVKTYKDLGYNIIDVPYFFASNRSESIEKRVTFIEQKLKEIK